MNLQLEIFLKSRVYCIHFVTSYVEAIEEEEVTIFNDDVKNQAACRPSGRYGENWDLFQPLFEENYPANT